MVKGTGPQAMFGQPYNAQVKLIIQFFLKCYQDILLDPYSIYEIWELNRKNCGEGWDCKEIAGWDEDYCSM